MARDVKLNAPTVSSKRNTIYVSQTRKATGGLPRMPYDVILYGEKLAKEFERNAAMYESPVVNEQEPQFPLGASGHFGQVARAMPLEVMVETRVYGPAHSKAVRYTHDLMYDEMHDSTDKVEEETKYESRHVEDNLIRDEITFMPTLEESVHIPEKVIKEKRKPPKMIGKILDESEIKDRGDLTVSEQLCDRLVKVDNNGFAIKIERPQPLPDFLSKDQKDETELNQTLNSQLRDALQNFESLYQKKISVKFDEKRKRILNANELKGYQRRHKMMLLSLPRRIKKKLHAFMNNDENDSSEDEILDDDHPTIRLNQSIDDLDIISLQNSLKEGANTNHSINGRTPIQTVMARLCKIDSGDELDWNAFSLEYAADLLTGWGCNLNALDCEIQWNGWAPIHYAACYGQLKRLEWLIKCGASVHTKTAEGHTALMLASENGKFKHTYLLVKNGANFRESDPLERTVLHYAAAGGDLNVVKFLVQCGCVHDKLKLCRRGQSPISISAKVNEACFNYLSKISIPRRLDEPLIDRFLQSQEPLSKMKNKAKIMKRGYVKRKK